MTIHLALAARDRGHRLLEFVPDCDGVLDQAARTGSCLLCGALVDVKNADFHESWHRKNAEVLYDRR